MATPLTAGCVALLARVPTQEARYRQPHCSILKATLIAGAVRLPGQAAADALLDSAQGYGRVNVERSLHGCNSAAKARALRTGQISTNSLALIGCDQHPAHRAGLQRLSRCRADQQPQPHRHQSGGKRYVGNQGGNSLTADSKNNVEVVQVANAPAGNWKIDVVASNVSQGPQDFALAAVKV